MELEIAGLIDRPSVQLPVTDRLKLVKIRQQRFKDPECRTNRPNITWPRKSGAGSTKLVCDLLFVPYTTGPRMVTFCFNTIDVGHIRSVNPSPDGGEPVRWWTIHPPHPFSYFTADPSQDVLVLLEHSRPDIVQVVSIASGNSVLDGGFLNVPAPDPGLLWALNQVQVHEDLIAVAFCSPQSTVGITIVGWKYGSVKAVSLLEATK